MDDFFNISERSTDGQQHIYKVTINANHRVFAGHFPGRPVVPGVMTMMMVRMCAEDAIGRATRFATVGQCKYNQAILPDGQPIVVRFTTDGTAITADVESAEGVSYVKMKGTIA